MFKPVSCYKDFGEAWTYGTQGLPPHHQLIGWTRKALLQHKTTKWIRLPQIQPINCTLGRVGGSNNVQGTPCRRLLNAHWLSGLWSINPRWKVSCRRLPGSGGTNSSIVHDPLVEPGCTPLYVGLPCTWRSVNSDHICSPFCGRAP
jgi:hypothetical protein